MSADTKARSAKTGRDVRNRGRGAVQQVAAPLLARADMSTEEWERQVLEMAHGLKFSQRTGGSFIARSEELSLESVRDLVQNKLLEPKFYAGAQMMFARRAAAADAAHFDGGQVTCTSCGRVIERDDMLSADSGAAAVIRSGRREGHLRWACRRARPGRRRGSSMRCPSGTVVD